MNITVQEGPREEHITVEQLASQSTSAVDMRSVMPGVSGLGIDLLAWYREWTEQPGGQMPTHLQVEASDDFQALIPWAELRRAALKIREEDGSSLVKGNPARLYVPCGSSECLHVKSVAKLRFLHDGSLPGKSEFGFRNTIPAAELLRSNSHGI